MAGDLRRDAGLAGPDTAMDLTFHTRPDKTGGNLARRGPRTSVGNAVKAIKNLIAAGRGNDGAGRRTADVAPEKLGRTRYRDLAQGEGGVLEARQQLRIRILSFTEGEEIHSTAKRQRTNCSIRGRGRG